MVPHSRGAHHQLMEVKSFELGSDQKVAKVEFVDGTTFERLGPQRWIVNADHPRSNECICDVIVASGGRLKFQYKYPKTHSQCNLEVRLHDGRKLALRSDDQKLYCPSVLNGPSIKTLEETAISALEPLKIHIYEGPKRLRLLGVSSAEGMLNFNYLLSLNSTEERPLVQAVRSISEGTNDRGLKFEIVSSDQPLNFLPPPSPKKPQSDTDSSIPNAVSFHSETTYYYDEPRPEHTATTVIFIIEEKTKRLKVVTGIRGGEPFKGREALPGGFVDVQGTHVENVYDAAVREVKEETGGQVQKLQLLRVSDARKDPRNQVIDSQFIAQISESDFEKLQASDDLKDLHSRYVADLLAEPEQLAFDHNEALSHALAACKTRPDLRLAAYNTARDAEYNKAIAKQSKNLPSVDSPVGKAAEQKALSAILVDLLGFLKREPVVPKENLREKVETEIRRKNPSLSAADLDYIRAKVMQIQYEEIDYALSKTGWTAAVSSDGSISGSFQKGAVMLDAEQAKAFSHNQNSLEDATPVPADVNAAIALIVDHPDVSPSDLETIRHLEKVLVSDNEQRALLESGYRKAIGDAQYTKASALLEFLLSYCGKKPEDVSNQTSSGR
jgi:8-oxo-dGTP diphosphatase